MPYLSLPSLHPPSTDISCLCAPVNSCIRPLRHDQTCCQPWLLLRCRCLFVVYSCFNQSHWDGNCGKCSRLIFVHWDMLCHVSLLTPREKKRSSTFKPFLSEGKSFSCLFSAYWLFELVYFLVKATSFPASYLFNLFSVIGHFVRKTWRPTALCWRLMLISVKVKTHR